MLATSGISLICAVSGRWTNRCCGQRKCRSQRDEREINGHLWKTTADKMNFESAYAWGDFVRAEVRRP